MKYLNKFYLDKEKDIIIYLYKSKTNEITYIIETPNHKTGNLITNLAKICNVETIKNDKNMKIIKGIINADKKNKDSYSFYLGNIHVATIYNNGDIINRVKILAITKTLMSQTKDYKGDAKDTIIETYIEKKFKLNTDVHTHMHAILSADNLIALGIVHQIQYPLYFIKKINLKLTPLQEKNFNEYINFADLILNNLENAEENINKIRNSLSIIKDGQAVFTNLEKLYLYRYVFTKGQPAENKIELSLKKINKISENDIKKYLIQMILDKEHEVYKNNNIMQDKLLWIARNYKEQDIKYVEIALTCLTKKGEEGIKFLEDVHQILPYIEEETKVAIRFLVAIRRIWLTQIETREALDVLKATSKSPYVVGSDIIGEELNDIDELKYVIKELVEYVAYEDENYTIRIHAGENDSVKENLKKAVNYVEKFVPKGKKTPNFRIGHGLYGIDLTTEEGKKLIKKIKKMGIVLEFQLSSNIRLNNLTELKNHPIKYYLDSNIKCVQGTDGCGIYGTNTIEEQIALSKLLGLKEEDFKKMKNTEDEIINKSKKYFKIKSKKFNEILSGRTIREAIVQLENEYIKNNKDNENLFKANNNLEAKEVLKEKIKKLPNNKIPIIIAGGSFNSNQRETILNETGKNILKELVGKIDSEKAYFVVGHKMQGYEKELLNISSNSEQKFEINAIIPKTVTEEVKKRILDNNINGVCISNASEELGIYKSFNYEIFERNDSIVVAFDGNSAVSNLIQEAKNGKSKSKIYVNEEVETLKQKAEFLDGYVTTFKENGSIIDNILLNYPELKK